MFDIILNNHNWCYCFFDTLHFVWSLTIAIILWISCILFLRLLWISFFSDNDRIDMFYELHIISLITLVSGIAHISEASWSSAWEIPRCACSDIAGDYYTPLTGLRNSSILSSQQRSVWALDLILENIEVWTIEHMPVWASMWRWKY